MRRAVAPVGQEVEVTRRFERHLLEVGIGLHQLLLPDLELGQLRSLPDEVDPDIELTPVLALRKHVVDRGNDVAGLEVSATEPEPGRVEVGHQGRLHRRHLRVGERPSRARLLPVSVGVQRLPVLHALGHGGPYLAQQRGVHGQGLIDPLEHRHALGADQDTGDDVSRERSEHAHVQHADLEAARLAQVLGHDLQVRDDRALPDQNPVGVVGQVADGPGVGAARELRELGQGLIGEPGHVVEVERPLCRHALGVGVLVLHRPSMAG